MAAQGSQPAPTCDAAGPADAATAGRGDAAETDAKLWSKVAESQFGMLPLSDLEHSPGRQAAWRAYVGTRAKAEAAADEQAQRIAKVLRSEGTDGDFISAMSSTLQDRSVLELISESVAAALAASPRLTEQDRAVLQRSVVNQSVDIRQDDFGGFEPQTATLITRLHSPASTAAVDLKLYYHHRMRWSSVEYLTRVDYRLVDAAALPAETSSSEKPKWRPLFTYYQDDSDPRLEPEDIPWVFNPVHRFRLTPQRLTAIRQHLFGSAAADLSDRLSDFELVQLLICCTGAAWDDITPTPGPLALGDEGWLDHHVRKTYGCLRPEDADYEPVDYESDVLNQIAFWVERHRDERIAARVIKRIDKGLFSREAFRQNPPKGYFTGDPRGS